MERYQKELADTLLPRLETLAGHYAPTNTEIPHLLTSQQVTRLSSRFTHQSSTSNPANLMDKITTEKEALQNEMEFYDRTGRTAQAALETVWQLENHMRELEKAADDDQNRYLTWSGTPAVGCSRLRSILGRGSIVCQTFSNILRKRLEIFTRLKPANTVLAHIKDLNRSLREFDDWKKDNVNAVIACALKDHEVLIATRELKEVFKGDGSNAANLMAAGRRERELRCQAIMIWGNEGMPSY
jgi:hypothetical protein